MNALVIGLSAGDESKGSTVHRFSNDYDWVVRFSGGNNCGHTIYRDGVKFVHNLLPSVDYRNGKTKSYLGSGMVIHLSSLYDEILRAEKSYPGIAKTIYVDMDAFLVEQCDIDEDQSNRSSIGSTGKGIGPAYKRKIGRTGTRLKSQMGSSVVKDLQSLGVHFVHVLQMRDEFLRSKILFEGAQGLLLDVNHGTYPFVSCGDSTLAGVHASGFGFVKIDKIYGVAKAYTTRVGEGPFPTEYFGDDAENLRRFGKEYGAVSGRPRRVGSIDLPALKYACLKSNVTDLIITKFDVLNGQSKVKLCTSYETEPVCGDDFFTAKPNYVEVDGWEDASKEPEELQNFVRMIEDETGILVDYISFGVDEDQFVRYTGIVKAA